MNKDLAGILPTREMYSELQKAFDHFNVHLFGGVIPQCLITLQRKKSTQSYFLIERFTNRDGIKVDEIALNPSYFAVQTLEDSMRDLVHEMAHIHQHHFGKPGRSRYHNDEWAQTMMSIGLIPSETGRPGGKKTGDKMDDYADPNGAFKKACNQLLTKDFTLSWLDRFPVSIKQLAHTLHQLPEETVAAMTEEELSNLSIHLDEDTQKKPSTICYSCPLCVMKVWGKPNLHVICGACSVTLQVN